MITRWALAVEYDEVRSLYETCGYRGGLNDADLVAIAYDQEIIGAVRLCREHRKLVLRGMQVLPARQRMGVGLAMLNFLRREIDIRNCYCLPYAHLRGFYGKIGFVELSKDKAPAFLAERLEKYHAAGGSGIIIMKIEAGNHG